MTRSQFKIMIGEDPEDMFGPDWKNIFEGWKDSGELPSEYLKRIVREKLSNNQRREKWNVL